jgi:hypothetical protein
MDSLQWYPMDKELEPLFIELVGKLVFATIEVKVAGSFIKRDVVLGYFKGKNIAGRYIFSPLHKPKEYIETPTLVSIMPTPTIYDGPNPN